MPVPWPGSSPRSGCRPSDRCNRPREPSGVAQQPDGHLRIDPPLLADPDLAQPVLFRRLATTRDRHRKTFPRAGGTQTSSSNRTSVALGRWLDDPRQHELVERLVTQSIDTRSVSIRYRASQSTSADVPATVGYIPVAPQLEYWARRPRGEVVPRRRATARAPSLPTVRARPLSRRADVITPQPSPCARNSWIDTSSPQIDSGITSVPPPSREAASDTPSMRWRRPA